MLPFRLSARAVLVFAVFLTIAAVNAVSDTAPRNPKSKAAVDAKVKYDHAADAAEATYRKAILAAKRQYLQELNAAFKSALKAEKLDEAKLISDERQQLEIDIEFLKGGTATIAANQ